MFMILLHHLVVHNVVDYKAMDPGIFRFLLQFLFVSGGKVGVVIFFAISAWFMADAATGVKASFRRVWMLEKEALFYGVVLGFGCYLTIDGVGLGALLHGVFPPYVLDLVVYDRLCRVPHRVPVLGRRTSCPGTQAAPFIMRGPVLCDRRCWFVARLAGCHGRDGNDVPLCSHFRLQVIRCARARL